MPDSDTGKRIHQVSCSILTAEPDTDGTFEAADKAADRLIRYARKLGFSVMHENVDRFVERPGGGPC